MFLFPIFTSELDTSKTSGTFVFVSWSGEDLIVSFSSPGVENTLFGGQHAEGGHMPHLDRVMDASIFHPALMDTVEDSRAKHQG